MLRLAVSELQRHIFLQSVAEYFISDPSRLEFCKILLVKTDNKILVDLAAQFVLQKKMLKEMSTIQILVTLSLGR